MIKRAKSVCLPLLLVTFISACAARAPVPEAEKTAATPTNSEDSLIIAPDRRVSTIESGAQPSQPSTNSQAPSVVKTQQDQFQSQQKQISKGIETATLGSDTGKPSSISPSTSTSESPEQPSIAPTTKERKTKPTNEPSGNAGVSEAERKNQNNASKSALSIQAPVPLIIDQIRQTGKLENNELSEVSGFAASRSVPGVLYAINDSGNSATLYALSETGRHLAQWSIDGRNRDWEDMAAVTIDGQHFLVIGDTGDNLKVHKRNRLYFFSEPLFEVSDGSTLQPDMTLSYVYEDGPRNVEAFAIHDGKVLLISKEPLQSNGPTRSRLYELSIPDSTTSESLTARFLTELPLAPKSLESSLAANFASVDLDHITALDFDRLGQRAFLLTYREVRVVERSEGQSWEEALQSRGKRLHFHNLGQSEALAVTADQAVFITSENTGAQIWAIPAR